MWSIYLVKGLFLSSQTLKYKWHQGEMYFFNLSKFILHMKSILFPLLIILSACGTDSSTEGRMTKKIQEIQMDFDTLKMNQRALIDTLSNLREDLNNRVK